MLIRSRVECDSLADRLNSLTTDEMLSLHSYLDQRRKFIDEMRQTAEDIRNAEKRRLDGVSQVRRGRCKGRLQTAMSVTCEVVEAQNVPRKRFIQWTKANAGDALQAEERLRKLVVGRICSEMRHSIFVNCDQRGVLGLRGFLVRDGS
jgi:hypothetical protein